MRVCLADRLKRVLAMHGRESEDEVGGVLVRQRHNLACLVSTLLADRALSLSVLKVIPHSRDNIVALATGGRLALSAVCWVWR